MRPDASHSGVRPIFLLLQLPPELSASTIRPEKKWAKLLRLRREDCLGASFGLLDFELFQDIADVGHLILLNVRFPQLQDDQGGAALHEGFPLDPFPEFA